MIRVLIQSKYKRTSGETYTVDNFWWHRGEITHVDLLDDNKRKYPMLEINWLYDKIRTGELSRVK